MKQIRKNLFETNSSSTHVITIANNNEDDFKNNLPETIEFNVGEYGWEFERYDDMQSRADYLFTAIVGCGVDAEPYINKLVETLKSWGVEAKYPELTKKETSYGCYYNLKGLPGKYFGIDHASELRDFLEQVVNDETLLMNYLFSPESFIATGNDNDDETLDDETNAKNILMTFEKGN